MNMKTVEEQLKDTSIALRKLESNVNARKDLERVHRNNLFNRLFSAMLGSYSDFEIVGLRLERTVNEQEELERQIQREQGDKKEIPDHIQKMMRRAHCLLRENQADFKALYIFAKIFLDEYTVLLRHIHNWRGIGDGSVTKFYSAIQKYSGDDQSILDFKESCSNRLKAVDVFITQYRDKYIVHDQTEHKETRWFLNDMRGGIRFIGGRPSITPPELVFVVAGCVSDTTEFTASRLLA